MTPEEIVGRIMTQHWDMAACKCWVCENGREAGLHPKSEYLDSAGDYPRLEIQGGNTPGRYL